MQRAAGRSSMPGPVSVPALTPRALLLVLAACAASPQGCAAARTGAAGNPIRRVVSLLQNMQSKIVAEGEKDQKLVDRYQCYCTKTDQSLQLSIQDLEARVPQLQSGLEEARALHAQLESNIVQHKKDRDATKAAIVRATSNWEKEEEAYKEEHGQINSFIDALEKAIAALERGQLTSFLQTQRVDMLKKLVQSTELDQGDKDTIVAIFLSGADQAPPTASTQEIIGILKGMKDTVSEQDLSEAEHKALMKAKRRELEALQKSIEEKTARLGEVGVEVVQLAEDLDDTENSLKNDKKFLVDLSQTCNVKKQEWEERSASRTKERQVISEVIQILNNDDALELFKKTLPSPSLLQLQVSSKEVLQQARQVMGAASTTKLHDYRLNLLALSLRAKQVNFEKVIQMIDDMVGLLSGEQASDDTKKTYCNRQFDKAEDEGKALERKVSTLDKKITDNKAALVTLTEDIIALEAEIKELDKQVASATEQRKREHASFVEDLAANSAAKQVIDMAKHRLSQFYNPKLGKAPEGEVVEAAPTLVQVSAHRAGSRAVPAPPPETQLAYQKQGEENLGVLSLLDLLQTDLAKQMTEMTVDEKDAQAEYEKLIKDSGEKRATDTQFLAEKESSKADIAGSLQMISEESKAKMKEVTANEKYIHGLHMECDWLIQNFEVRKEARANEMDTLQDAKAVLSGADYSLLQASSRHLRAHHM